MSRRAARFASGLLALAAASSLAACASLPTSPNVQPVDATQSAAGPGAAGARSVPVPPDPSWAPEQVVTGFLAASADSIPTARRYLAPGYQASWHPAPWAATVVDQSPDLAVAPQTKVTAGTDTTVVILTPKYLASLNSVGPLEAGNLVSAKPRQYLFELTRSAGVWRITHLDSATMLMLTEPDFVRDYQPRNLYFFAGPSSSVLVPEPVFVPEQANIDPGERAKGLVKALLRPPTGWLTGAAATAFPLGTKLNGVLLSGGDAVVDLGGAAARTSAYQRQQMAAQLLWTLTSSSYMPASDIRSVALEFNGQPWQGGAQLLLPGSKYGRQVPLVSAGPLYYLATSSSQGLAAALGENARMWTPGGPPVPVPLPRGLSKISFSGIAVSPGGSPPRFAGCSGNSVYISALNRAADVRAFTLSAACSALSWDPGGDLWLAAGHTIYVVTPDSGLTQVGEPLTLTRDSVVALRVAPDGVRMALIVTTPAGTNQVLMAAISQNQMISIGSPVSVGSDLIHPVALSWYDPDHLVVLDQPAAGSAQMYEVPLDGGASAQLSTAPGTVSVAASNWGIALGTGLVNMRQIEIIPRPTGQWQQIGAGVAVVFPG